MSYHVYPFSRTPQAIRLEWHRYAHCHYADEVQPYWDAYRKGDKFYQWEVFPSHYFPSPTLVIDFGENVEIYSGVNKIKNAFQTHFIFQHLVSNSPLILLK